MRPSGKAAARSWTAVASLLTFCSPGPVAARKVSLSASSGMMTSSGFIAPLGEIFGQRSGDVDRFLARARHDEARCVEQHRSARHAVDAVADDPVAERLARVNANLMAPAGARLEFDHLLSIAYRN